MKKLKKALLVGLALSAATVVSCSEEIESSSQSGSTSLVPEETVKIYASPTGSTDGDGTKENPYEVYEAFRNLKAGYTLVLLEGIYNTPNRFFIDKNQSGKPGSPIKVIAEEGKNVEFDFRDQEIADASRGIQLNANYWHFKGLRVRGAGDNGIYVGGSYNIIESCITYENQDTGIQLGRAFGSDDKVHMWPHNNLIKNCTSFNNYDYKSFGENADGFAAKLTVGEGNVFDGCIAYRNADDGWDLYAKSDSGNVGTTVIKNCVAFENGWMLDKVPVSEKSDLDEYGKTTINTTRKMQEKEGVAYTTRDGDGIGFKLGGSVMEGNVILDNCLTFNNRLHGVSDNSNPGVLSLSNVTAFNNSMDPDPNTGLPIGSDEKNKSNNIDTARSETSYNNYYGILSYMTNQNNPNYSYTNKDAFKGSAGYSIFNMGKNKYTTIKEFIDANSYNSQALGKAYNGLSDGCFESTALPFDITKETDVHNLLRNADESINMGSMLKVISPELLTYCEGKQIGANLSKTSWDAYDHYDLSDYHGSLKEESIMILEGAKDALEVMCNPNAVYQNLLLLTSINGCKVEWQSSDDRIIQIGTRKPENQNEFIEHSSVSGLTYIDGVIHRQRDNDHVVTLTAVITDTDGNSVQKEFAINVKKDVLVLGDVVGFESSYTLATFSDFDIPTPRVLNATSYSGKELIAGTDYTYTSKILYALTTADFDKGNYYEISKVYSTVAGVYKVVYTIESKISSEVKESSFFVYVVSEDAQIDVANGEYNLNVSRDGVIVDAALTNIYGDLYVYTSEANEATYEEIITNGQKFAINSESIRAICEVNNDHAYNVFFFVANKKLTYKGEIYSQSINIKNIATNDDFQKVVTASDSTTIYMLQNDLDFTNYSFKTSTVTFGSLFNGNGYTIKNLVINGTEKKDAAVFYALKNATIMNVNFENITINGAKDNKNQDIASLAGIVGQMTGGYIHNVALKNVTAHASTGVGAMVGQISGGYNYVSQVSLVNDSLHTLTVSNKYCGGLIGNIQKDTDKNECVADVRNCFVNAVVGDGTDSGGYVGGIVGRAKNDYDVCKTTIDSCYYTGQVRTGKNYVGGIFAGTDNGAGSITLTNNISICTIYFAGTVLDGLSAGTMSQKNAATILGRQTVGQGAFKATNNFSTFEDVHFYTETEDVAQSMLTKVFWEVSLGYDMDNIWQFNEETNTVSLRGPVHRA